ncbi:hypothetical protein BV96_03724 [Sphingomonas paucimobilis]|nr:hypothetical protein BV96_03724 [Sphingomonas paucimobilis]
MTFSLTIIGIYTALLSIALLAPYASACLGPRAANHSAMNWSVCVLLLGGAIILTIARHGAVPLLGVFVLIPLLGLGVQSLLGGITAAMLFATVIWWTWPIHLGPIPVVISALLALGAGLLTRCARLSVSPRTEPRLILCLLVCVIIGLATGLLTTPFESAEPIYTAWHHWGAYLAPVEAWRAGGMPYRDFPLQYGLGPTSLLLASCGNDCWRGMYIVTISANALYFATLSGSAILLTARFSRGVRWLALFAMFCATFLWTGFPVSFASPVMTPSVGGLRFLTISALLFHILLSEDRQIRRDWIGHAIWLLDLYWSPEAAFFGTVIWWPYLALRDAEATSGGRDTLIALVRGILRGIGALVIGIGALAATLWLISGKSIRAEQFFAYILHPPGPLPVNPVGTVWIVLASIALALPILMRQGLSSRSRPLYVCLLGLLAAGSYYISRSHDNNILNLFPLLLLLLLGILANLDRTKGSAQSFTRSLIHTFFVAMIAFVVTFDFTAWREGVSQVGPLHLGPTRLISRFSPKTDDTPAMLPPDALAGLQQLRESGAGAIVLVDRYYLMPRSSDPAWTPVNNLANFIPLPETNILYYIRRGAEVYHRPGWILVNTEYRHWIPAFRTAYEVRDEKSFGSYRAFYLVPRQDSK